jgi:hypothetical protein
MDFKRRAAPAGRLDRREPESAARLIPAAYSAIQPPAAAPQSGATAQQLIDRAVTAKGGASKLRAVKTVRATATLTVTVPSEGPADLETVTSIRYPGSFRSESKMPAGVVTQVFQNGRYWVQGPNGVREQPGPVANEMRANIQRDSIGLLLGLLDKRLAAVRIPDVDVDGRKMPAVEVKGPTMPPLTVVFDPVTALPVRQRYKVVSGRGAAPSDTEEEFSDFRDVGGIKVPFRATIRVNGAVTLKRTVHKVEYNVPLDPALFILES